MFERDRDFIMLQFTLGECARALTALHNVDLMSKPKPHPRHTGEVYEIIPVFDNIRLALQLSANASKMLWPPRNRARGAHLRTLIGVPENHPLKDRTLRNHVDHIDERLDAWTATSPRPFIMVEMIAPPAYLKDGKGVDLADIAAIVYDQGTKTIHLFGDSFSLVALRTGLRDIHELVRKALEPMNLL